MLYKLTFEDGSEAIAHHGVKGMHWGEWNEETKERYGYTIPKGAKIKRYSTEREGREGTDLSRPFYATSNEQDFDTYGTALDQLWGTGKRDASGKLENTLSSISLRAVDDVTVASGKQMVRELLGVDDLPALHDYDSRVKIHGEAKRLMSDPEVRESYRKRGYDALEDIEDMTAPVGFDVKSPLLVLNGSKFKVDDVEFFDRRRQRERPYWD